jgi:DNA-binding PucR family transcriptional regulator
LGTPIATHPFTRAPALLPRREALRRVRELDVEELLATVFGALPEPRRRLALVIEVLADHDRNEGTQLVRTLQVFADAGRSVSRSARTLGVHRHTVVNRISQAERLLGRSLRGVRDGYILELALLASRIDLRMPNDRLPK